MSTPDEFARYLDGVRRSIIPTLSPVVTRAALNIKNDAIKRFRAQASFTYLPHYSRAISYDNVSVTSTDITTEVGPESSKPQGGMGRGVEFGSARGRPIPHLLPAADAEEDKFEKFIAQAVAKAFR